MELYEKIHPEGWKDYPDTTTPIEGDNLTHIEEGIYENSVNIKKVNNVTKYITATAGADGDFWIDIENDLVAGMVLNVSFPVATNPDSNARLSIDGGVSYVNIRTINNIPLDAIAIENKNIELYFDGTNFRETTLKRDMITIKLTNDYYITENDTYELADFSIVNQIGNRLTLSGNKIVVGSGVGKVKISAQAYWLVVGGSNANRFFTFFKGSVSPNNRASYFTVGERNSIYWTDFIQTVVKGDQLSFQFYGKIGDKLSPSGTMITVEVVE